MADIEKDLDLDDLLKQKARKDKEADELEQKIRQARQANATKNYDKVVELLTENGRFFSLIQRNTIKRLVEPGDAGRRDRTSTREPKFQLDNGKTWTGHGKKTAGFDDWAMSEEGQKWQAANPGQQFPSYPNPKVKGA